MANDNGWSSFLRDEIVDHVFGNGAYSVPTIWVSLFNGDPEGAGSELAGNNYARVAHASWDASSNGVTANNGSITFPTASGAWSEASFVALHDASTVGNRLMSGPLDTPITLASGQFIVFQDGNLTSTLAF